MGGSVIEDLKPALAAEADTPVTASVVRRDFKAMEDRRYQAIALLEQGCRPADVARRLKISCQSVCRWRDIAAAKGRHGLVAAGRAGRKAKITPEQMVQIATIFRQNPRQHGIDRDQWTLTDLVEVIRTHCGVSYRPTGVWYLLDRMGLNLCRSGRRSSPRMADQVMMQVWSRSRT